MATTTDLLKAIQNSQSEEVIAFLTSNPEKINACVDKSHTPLELALQFGYLSLASKLVDLDGFDLNCEGHNPLRCTINIGYLPLADKLLNKGANPNYFEKGQGSLLQLAIETGLFPLAEKLIEKGAEVNFRDGRGWTAIMYAAFRGDKKTVEFLLKHNADPNICNNDGWNTCVGAFATGHSEIANLLLEKGGNFAEKYAQAALMSCYKKGFFKLAYKLLDHGVNPNFSDKESDPLLCEAINSGKEDLAIALLEHGADPNTIDKQGVPVLTLSTKMHLLSVTNKLLECGAECQFTNKQESALMAAVRDNDPELVKYLVSSGVPIDAQDTDGYTALHFAALWENESMIQLLLSLKANKYIKNKYGNTPIMTAKKSLRHLF